MHGLPIQRRIHLLLNGNLPSGSPPTFCEKCTSITNIGLPKQYLPAVLDPAAVREQERFQSVFGLREEGCSIFGYSEPTGPAGRVAARSDGHHHK